MKKYFFFSLFFLPFTFRIYSQESQTTLQERIVELESLIGILQAKLVEVDEYKFLLYIIIGAIIFLLIWGTNASFKRKISKELHSIKKQLIEKYRDSIAILAVESETAMLQELKKIELYNLKTRELSLDERDWLAADWLIKGLESLYLKRYEKSIGYFDRALVLEPDYAASYYNSAFCFTALGKDDKAIENYRKAIEFSPEFPEAWCNLGMELQKTERNEEAVEAYSEAIRQRPDFPKAYEQMGTDLRKLKRKEEAVQAYNKMGDTLLQMGREEEAVEAYNNMAIDLINLGPEEDNLHREPVHNHFGIDLESLQKEEVALEIYYKQGNEFLKCDRHDEAIEAFDKIIKMHPEDLEAVFSRAKVLLRMGREDEALQGFTLVAKKDKTHVKAHYFLGKALMKMGEWDKAVSAFKRVIELKPDYPETYHKLACISALEEDLEGILINLRRYFELSLDGAEENVEKDDLFEKYKGDFRLKDLLAEFRSGIK